MPHGRKQILIISIRIPVRGIDYLVVFLNILNNVQIKENFGLNESTLDGYTTCTRR